jgi:hypothetical protein
MRKTKERKMLTRYYLNPALIRKIHKRFGTHTAAAKALSLPLRTYADWRLKGFRRETQLKQAAHYLERELNETTK